MARLFGIAGAQLALAPWDYAAAFEQIADTTRQVAKTFPWVQMLVFHELALPAMATFASPRGERWHATAEPIGGAWTQRLCELARETRRWLIPGSLLEREGEKLYNTALAISPEGEVVARYRKMFPWLPYESWATRGEEFCVFEVPEVGRFGLCICYDSWFPEVARQLAWMGAEVILHPTLTATSDRQLELPIAQANAIFNQCYFIDVNAAAPVGAGRSQIIDPDGRVLQQAGEGGMIMTEILDLDRVAQAREYGNLGLGQTLKQLRESGQRFPIYEQGFAAGPGFQALGPLTLHREL